MRSLKQEGSIPRTLLSENAVYFWLTVILTGAGAGIGAIVLTKLWPGVPPGLFAVVGAGAVLAATTHGPISAIVLVMELTARDRSFMLPLVLAVVTATIVARTLDPRSIYDARFSNREIEHLQKARKPAPV